MATRNQVTYNATGVAKQERWSNGTQAGDPAAGYAQINPANGAVIAGTTRALTAQEAAGLAADDASNNRSSLDSKAVTAIAANVTFLAIASPTTAQVTAQVKALTRQVTALIRIIEDQLADTSGT